MQLATLSPNAAVELATLGFGLIVLELNRPGLVLSGACGLLCMLLSAASLGRVALQPWALGLLLASSLALASNLWAKLPLWIPFLSTAGLVVGLHSLVSAGGQKVSVPVALVCGLSSGAAAAFLSRVALRARRAKQVN